MSIERRNVGRYEVIDCLGRGGMGVVYKARDPELDRFVALKLLSRGDGSAADRRGDLLREARAAAALDHPAIATVYEVGEADDGCVFLAMAYYDGETLEARLSRGPLPSAEAVRIGHEIASGLAAAHARGVIHCDLKPGNVMLTSSGAVKLLDFGIARRSMDETRPAQLAGTLAYMPPELFEGHPGDARADVWAFGIVLYEMIEGQRPFGATPSLHWSADPELSELWPAGLPSIVRRALERDPEARFADGGQLRAALDGLPAASGGAVSSERLAAVPTPLTTFVGRERDVASIVEQLSRIRLLTLTGPGGIGKTRLAQQVALAMMPAFDGDILFVPLAAIADPALLGSELGRILGVRERPDVSMLDGVMRRLGTGRSLIVFDNLEHLRPAAAAISRLLGECPGVRLLVTSRVPLRITGEHEYPLAPLPMLPVQAAAGRPDLAASPATSLFVDRMRAARPEAPITDDDAHAIVEICTRLDGLPLAIELAAARAKMFPPRAIVSRLDERLDWLRTRAVDRPARHQSLRQAIAWSYDLLDDGERAIFRLLAVFPGGCRIDDATAVARAVRADAGDVADVCEGLCDHSLVSGHEDADGQPRISMLETIREYALEQLVVSGEAEASHRAHALRYLEMAETAAPQLTGPAQASWFDRFDREHANLRAALAWVVQAEEPELALRLGAALWRFWIARGYLREGRDQLERILAMPGTGGATRLRAAVLHGTATLVHEISDYGRALPIAQESLSISRAIDDREMTAMAVNNVAWLLVRLGEPGAEAACREGLTLNEALGDVRGRALALHNLAWLFAFRGDYAQACALNEQSLDHRRAHGDARGIAYSMTNLAWMEIQRGGLPRAASLLDEARSTLERLGDQQLLAWALAMQGLLEHAAGRPDDAADRFTASIARWREVGNILGLGFTLVGDAALRLSRGDHAAALRNLEEAIGLLRRAGGASELLEALRTRAEVAAQLGDIETAVDCYREGVDLATRLGHPRLLAECRDAVERLARA